MSEKKLDSCVEAATGPIAARDDEPQTDSAGGKPSKEVIKLRAQVGKEAPDFEATAFVDGGFRNVRLSEYRGKWVLLCFYPGDFTFV